jgi:hypothetical protein
VPRIDARSCCSCRRSSRSTPLRLRVSHRASFAAHHRTNCINLLRGHDDRRRERRESLILVWQNSIESGQGRQGAPGTSSGVCDAHTACGGGTRCAQHQTALDGRRKIRVGREREREREREAAARVHPPPVR